MKICGKCEKSKPLSAFARRGRGYQSMCRECFSIYSAENRERLAETQRIWYRKIKMQVIEAYGGACACCGESNPAFLCLDHVNNDGAAWKRADLLSRSLWHWTWKQECPEDIQLLCANCNMAKHFNPGGCPHRPLSGETSVHQEQHSSSRM
jgi:hypothetical protein